MNVILILLAVSILSMASFSLKYSITPVKVDVESGSGANVTAHINSDINDTFLIVPVRWSSWVFPSEYYVEVNPGETNIPIKIIPFEDTIPGTYTVMINGYSVSSGKMYDGPVIVSVSRPYFIKISDVYVYGSSFPTGNVTIKFKIKNYGTKSISNLNITMSVVKNGETVFSNSVQESLNPGDDREERFNFTIPAGAKGTYIIKIIAHSDKKMYSEKSESLKIENKAIIKTTEIPYNVIFTKGKKIRIKNLGNVPKEYEYQIPISKFDSNVLHTNGNEIDGKITWKITVKPNEEKIIYYKVSYFPYVALLIVLILIAWYVSKRAQMIHVTKRIVKKDGSISILIEIDNTSGKEIKSVLVKDTMMPIFKILPHEYGPLFKVKKRKNNFEIIWNIPSMKSGEQRILSYDAHEIIGVHGNIEFPPAEITYKINGKVYHVTTNQASVKMESE